MNPINEVVQDYRTSNNKRKKRMGEAKAKIEAKKKAFEEDPSQFIHIKDVIFAAVREEKDGQNGISYLMNPSLPDHTAKIIGFDAMRFAMRQLDKNEFMRQAEEAKNDPGIITSPNGIVTGDNGKA